MISLNLQGQRAFVAGVGDDNGYGWAIAKALHQAGASVCVGVWPPVMGLFSKSMERGKYDESAVYPGGKLTFEKIYALDAVFDTPKDVPPEIRDDKRYKAMCCYTIQECASLIEHDFGERPLDIVVHSLANGPEAKKPLLETSRKGYLAAVSASAYSFVSMVQRFASLMRPGGNFLTLSYLAADRVIPGYGGGMSSAKAALECDTRVLAYEAGRKYRLRVNAISAGPLLSRAARATFAIDKMIQHYREDSPLPEAGDPEYVGHAAALLSSPLAAGITGTVLYVDHGYHVMGISPNCVKDETKA